MDKVNLAEKFATFSDHWTPRCVASCNGNDIRIVEVAGEFVWHTHDDTDDFFLVLEGELDIELRDRIATLGRASCSWSPAASSTVRSRAAARFA